MGKRALPFVVLSFVASRLRRTSELRARPIIVASIGTARLTESRADRNEGSPPPSPLPILLGLPLLC